MDLEGEVKLFKTPLTDVVIKKNWKDTFSLRLGGSTQLTDLLSFSFGSFWEQGATPAPYAHLDFPSFDRYGIAGGFGIQVISSVELMIGYMHIFESGVDVQEETAKVFQQRPLAPCPDLCDGYSGVPANSGRFKASFRSLTMGINSKF